MQILQVLAGLTKSKGWANHPAVKMWKGHEIALADYAYAICDEWTSHGYKDTCREKIKQIVNNCFPTKSATSPAWFGKKAFHKSHQSNLLRKKPEHYGRFFSNCSPDLPYVWPVQ